MNVTVVLPGGVSSISGADLFTYVPTPAVTAIMPSAGPLAGGTTVTITGTTFSNASQVYFGAAPATYVVIDSATQITATSPAGTVGTVDITVVTPGGNSAVSAADQYSYLVVPPAKLIASDGAAGSEFGSSVAISGSTMVIGAPRATVGTGADQGAAYVFTWSGTAWIQAARLTASDGEEDNCFGSSVSIDGGTIAVGAEGTFVGSNAGQDRRTSLPSRLRGGRT